MPKQVDIFSTGEGDGWWHRNKDKFPIKDDAVLAIIRASLLKPQDVLEIGCSNGWRIAQLVADFGCRCSGIDPSGDAIADGKTRFAGKIALAVGSAKDLAYPDASFDLVIYGFCLYLCDRDHLARIVAEGDRVLKDGGYLIIYDFISEQPHAVPYHHKPGVFSYKMDHSRLFTANPAYKVVASRANPADGSAAILLKKNVAAGWPLGAR